MFANLANDLGHHIVGIQPVAVFLAVSGVRYWASRCIHVEPDQGRTGRICLWTGFSPNKNASPSHQGSFIWGWTVSGVWPEKILAHFQNSTWNSWSLVLAQKKIDRTQRCRPIVVAGREKSHWFPALLVKISAVTDQSEKQVLMISQDPYCLFQHHQHRPRIW